MKKHLLFLLLFTGMVNAQIVNIPDEYFKARLLEANVDNVIALDAAGLPMKIDANGDGEIQNSEAAAVYKLRILGAFVFDLTGISSFTNLTDLDCSGNPLATMDLRALTNLKNLNCFSNRLTSLNVSGLTNLQQLFCNANKLASIDLSGLTNLTSLSCSDNLLGSLDVTSLSSLSILLCDNNKLSSLNVTGLSNLTLLYCGNNSLASLNLNGLTNLQGLYCSRNFLTNINVSNLTNLNTLDCYYNQLATLDLSNSSQLTSLSCGENSIPILNINNLTNLTHLECSYLPNNLVVNGANLNALAAFQYTGQNSNITFNGFPAIQNLNLTLLPSDVTVNVSGFGSQSAINIYGSAMNSLTVNGIGTSNIQNFNCANIQLASLNLNGLNSLKTLYCSNNKLTNLNLTNLTNLTYLDVGRNQIATIDISGLSNLKHLDCNNNKLTSLNLSGVPNLEYLNCSNYYEFQDPVKNQLTSLNLAGLTNLKHLDCSNSGMIGMVGALGNLVSSLEVNHLTNLEKLICSENKIAALTVNGLTNLTNLNVSSNLLTSLDLIGLTNLTHLNYANNQLSNLNMTGLVNITYLDCSNNNITTLNVLNMPNLTQLSCINNLLTTLNLSGLSQLSELHCDSNSLTSLSVNHLTTLTDFTCSSNQLTTLEVSNLTNLLNLGCGYNQLTNLDVTNLSNLARLYCDANQLTNIDVNSLSNMWEFSCSGNQFTNLDVSNLQLLTRFFCNGNQLTNLNVSNSPNMAFLGCSGNQLTDLNVSALKTLYELYCDNNQITNLDVSTTDRLRYLDCSDNQLIQLSVKNGYTEEYLDLANNPNLAYICADDAELAAVQTQLNGLGMTATVSNSYCSFTPGGPHNTVIGTTIFDGNNNGCNDNDPKHPNIRIDFSDGTTTGSAFTNTLGVSTFYADAGTYTIAPNIENASAFNISPASATISFPDNNYNIGNQSFCLSANGVHPDLEIVITPIFAAMPGFNATYKIVYKNKGNQVLSGNVNLAFDASRMDLVTAFPTADTQSTNNLQWNYNGLLPFESRIITLEFNINTPQDAPAVNNGDVLPFTTSITPVAGDEFPDDNTFTFNQVVVGSFDPNDITCIEGAVVPPSEIGNYLHYVVNFENTGTANAVNIVVKVAIDESKFDLHTLQLLDTSHSARAVIRNNVAEFIFENIQLPAAGDPPVGGHGNVLFKIKTLSTLVSGDEVEKSANIYFDYNAPIATGDASTTFATLSNPDFTADKSIILYPNPANNFINIDCDNMINLVELFDIQGRLLQTSVENKNTTTLDISNKSKGVYFVRISTENGKKVEKIIKE